MQSKENWNLNESSAPKKVGGQVYFAFPGMGKTTYARQHANVVDLDFGTYRSARLVEPKEQSVLYPEFSRLMKYYYKYGFIVLTNDYKLIPFVKQFAEGRMVMELPVNGEVLARRVMERDQAEGGNITFARALSQNVLTWVKDWERYAQKYHIPVIKTEFFKEVNMPYESKE